MRFKFKKFSVALALLCISTIAYAETFKIGLTSESWANVNKDGSQDFAKVLTKASKVNGDNFIAVTFSNSDEAAAALANHKVDLIYTKLQALAQLKQQNVKVHLLAVPYTISPTSHKKSETYASYFVTSKSNKAINSLKDLKGKSFLFNHQNSLSGFIYPVTDLKKQGIDYRNFFGSYQFNDSHHSTLDEVQARHIDAAVIWDSIYAGSKFRNQYKVIYRIEGIPNPPVLGSSTLTAEQIKKLQNDLAAVKTNALKNYYIAGFNTKVNDSFYDEALAAINLANTLTPTKK